MHSVRVRLLAVVTVLAVPGTAHAGVLVVSESESQTKAPNGAAGKPQYRGTMYVEGERVRIEGVSSTKEGEMEGTVLFRAQPESFVFLDSGEKTYTEVTRADAKRIGKTVEMARKQMQDQLAKMSPEQRAVVEQAMAGAGGDLLTKAPPARKPAEPATAVANGSTDKIADRPCRGFDVMRGGKKIAEACIASWADLGVAPADVEALRKMSSFQQQMLAEVNFEGFEAAPGAEAFEVMDQAKGFPLRVRILPEGKRPLTMRVVKFEKKDVDAKLFEVPAGYAKRDLSAEE